MNTSMIIKKAITLPFRAYKGFILTVFLFFISEMNAGVMNQIEIGDLTIIAVIAVTIINLMILGACIAVVYHYIDDSFNIKEASLTNTTKAGFKDTFLEFYYFSLAVVSTAIISLALGIYHNIYYIIDYVLYINNKASQLTLPKLLKYLSPNAYHQLTLSVVATLLIFIILFAVFLSYCSLAKIRLKDTGDLKESMNFIKLTKIIKDKGIRKYLNFVFLTLFVLGATFIIMRTLEPYLFIGSLLSAFTEAFSLFFILDSFTLFYHS